MTDCLKLWDIPRESKIYCQVSDGSSYVVFHHLDGMYSLCTSENGDICHLRASTPLVPDRDGYKIQNGQEKED